MSADEEALFARLEACRAAARKTRRDYSNQELRGSGAEWTLVCRTKQLDRVRTLLISEPLVSISGPTGIGKTAFLEQIESDAELLSRFEGRITRHQPDLARYVEHVQSQQKNYEPDTHGRPLSDLTSRLGLFAGRPFIYLVDDARPEQSLVTICQKVLDLGGSVVLCWKSAFLNQVRTQRRLDDAIQIELGCLSALESKELLVSNCPRESCIQGGGPVEGFTKAVVELSKGHPTRLSGVARCLRKASSDGTEMIAVARSLMEGLSRDLRRVGCGAYIDGLMTAAFEGGLARELHALSWFESDEPLHMDLRALVGTLCFEERNSIKALLRHEICRVYEQGRLVLTGGLRQALIEHCQLNTEKNKAWLDGQESGYRSRQFENLHRHFVQRVLSPDPDIPGLLRLRWTYRRFLWWLTRTDDIERSPAYAPFGSWQEFEPSSSDLSIHFGRESSWPRSVWSMWRHKDTSAGDIEMTLSGDMRGPETILSVGECAKFWESLYQQMRPKASEVFVSLVRIHVGRALMRCHRYAAAAGHLAAAQEALKDESSKHLLMARSKALRLQADATRDQLKIDDAVRVLKQAEQIHRPHWRGAPTHRLALIAVMRKFAKVYQTAGRLDDALQAMEGVFELQYEDDSASSRAYNRCLRGVVLRDMGLLDEAEADLCEACRLHEQGSEAHASFLAYDRNRLASTLILQGRPAEALVEAQAAAEVHEGIHGNDSPHCAIDSVRLAECHLALASPKEARTHIEKAIEIYNNDETSSSRKAYAHMVSARVFAALEQRERAKRSLKAAIHIHNSVDSCWYTRHAIDCLLTAAEFGLGWDFPQSNDPPLGTDVFFWPLIRLTKARRLLEELALPQTAPTSQLAKAIELEIQSRTGGYSKSSAPSHRAAELYRGLGRAWSADRVTLR